MRPSRTRVSALLAGVAMALSVTTLGSTTAAPASAATTVAPLHVGTYNIIAGSSTDTFRSAVNAVLPRVDVIGLQEVNSHAKEDVLRGLHANGWDYFRAANNYGEQNPVLWNTATYSLVSARTVKVFPATAASGRAHFVSVVRLQVRSTGENITVVNLHLPPGAMKNGRPNPNNLPLYRRYIQELATTAQVVQSEANLGGTTRRVFVTGDFNSAYKADLKYGNSRMPVRVFRRIVMISMWATEVPAGSRGTHLSSLIDQVFSTRRALDARVLFGVSGSDHFPAVATYAAS